MAEISYNERGSGHSVVLLHGFPMHQRVWDAFAEKLSENFKVYTPDLPGFGKSGLLKPAFSIEDVGASIADWLVNRNIHESILIGHSLGGYVALSIAGQRPELISGLGLFHSTAYADTAEKKESRNKVLEFINHNGVEAFTSSFITPLFADPKHPAIARVREIAIEASASTVLGYTLAMRDRTDKTSVLKSFPRPVLFIAGEKDPGISVNSIHEQSRNCKSPKVNILPRVGHMGMLEDEEKCLKIIADFVRQCTVTR